MKRRARFSERYELRKPEGGLIYTYVPERVVDGLMNLMTTESYNTTAMSIAVHRGLDRKMPTDLVIFYLGVLLKSSEWYELCDACEIIWEELANPRGFSDARRGTFSNELNDIFSRNYFGYELRDGQMERVGARAQDAAIAEARGILRDPGLSGPDEQFQKAMGFFNRRPEPDCENCVKEAVSAVDGVARVLLNDHKLTLSKALIQLQKEQDVHPTLIGLLEKLYAYRGDAEGVGHARTGEKEVRIEDAAFALGVSASAIVYLARLYGRAVA